ncbi:MAG: 7-cyano-7-deazaguanine synthase QueC [Campylobacteraceae bacterium]|jgi:7-cyano-7-deazaguanine synthase|nr:7-cyano-7-deazaguanine synthase QueC [Campylobacteraceae bacterium]MBT3882488.1 7-cyano-7-deazaguanine synthase QueC [Campylobacteraceae bacterium]MBT4030481.1 7-cyano-7-deazaguanine synthase QueC [Campylobacteraceae bacterium]MBT4179522.1 7-cyano-7-deazaguanine synthase QueC [Campylobacteraceae bacterium]MBT4572188.1 7-cyano-7-deazaguanine synthase QueC [Campylobacteraceae bacterium]
MQNNQSKVFRKKAVCILSGGMDSTLASYIAKKEDYDLIAVHFNYGQRTEHKELEAFRNICIELNIKDKYEINIPFFTQIGASALTDSSIDIPTDGLEEGVPVTYVPFRNGIFLSIATAIAEKHEASALFIGVVQEDSSGYPDCTDTFINKMQSAMNQGTKEETKLEIITPLVHMTKEQIVKKSLELNVPLKYTWSCYANEDKACGVCDSCRLRLKGFKLAGVKDEVEYI